MVPWTVQVNSFAATPSQHNYHCDQYCGRIADRYYSAGFEHVGGCANLHVAYRWGRLGLSGSGLDYLDGRRHYCNPRRFGSQSGAGSGPAAISESPGREHFRSIVFFSASFPDCPKFRSWCSPPSWAV